MAKQRSPEELKKIQAANAKILKGLAQAAAAVKNTEKALTGAQKALNEAEKLK